MRIIFSQRALSDIDGIVEYIAERAPHAAVNELDKIFDTIELLLDQPRMARRASTEGVRELVIDSTYLATYRVSGDEIEILRVWHGRQDRR